MTRHIIETVKKMYHTGGTPEETAIYIDKEVRKHLLKKYETVNETRRQHKQQEITYWTLPEGEVRRKFNLMVKIANNEINAEQ